MATPALPGEQTALLITAKGARYTVGKRHVPKPGAGQVLVHNLAAAVNPVDMCIYLLILTGRPKLMPSRLIQKTGMFIPLEGDFPAVTGQDGAGEVCALGDGVQGWNIGDKVFYQSRPTTDRSTFQEYTVVDAEIVARFPSNITAEQAASIPLCLATAAIGIYKPKENGPPEGGADRGGAGLTPPWAPGGMNKYAGQAALVISGSSCVGHFAVQLLKASGFSPIITTASSHNEDYCKAAGATHVIDYKSTPYDQLPAIVMDIVGDIPVGFVYDALAKGTNKPAFSVLAPGGGMASVSTPEVGKRGEDDEEGRRVVAVMGSANAEEHKAFGAEMYANLTDMLERGELKPTNIRILEGGLAAIPAACDELDKGVSGVKLVVRVP